jgi:hypothetical protein
MRAYSIIKVLSIKIELEIYHCMSIHGKDFDASWALFALASKIVPQI